MGQEPEPGPGCLGPTPSGTPEGKGTARSQPGQGSLPGGCSMTGGDRRRTGGPRPWRRQQTHPPLPSRPGVPAEKALTGPLSRPPLPTRLAHSSPARQLLQGPWELASPSPSLRKEKRNLPQTSEDRLVRVDWTGKPCSASKARQPGPRVSDPKSPCGSLPRIPVPRGPGLPLAGHLGCGASRALGGQWLSRGRQTHPRGHAMRPRTLPLLWALCS